jgi:transposase
MTEPLPDDDLWALIAPVIPVNGRRFHNPGRKRVPDRACLTDIVFGVPAGSPWEYLLQEMGCGSGMNCSRSLAEWQAAGVWQQVHAVLLARLNAAGRIDCNRAVGGGTGPAPTPRIAASPAPNTMSSRTARARRWSR